MRVRRALLRPRLRSFAAARRQLLGGSRRIALRHRDAVEAAHAAAGLRVRGHGQVYNNLPALGTPLSQSGTSVGAGVRAAWEDTYTADLSVAKAVEGPRDDWRAFIILGAKH